MATCKTVKLTYCFDISYNIFCILFNVLSHYCPQRIAREPQLFAKQSAIYA